MEGGRQLSLILELYLVFVNFWLFGCLELMAKSLAFCGRRWDGVSQPSSR